MNLSALPVARIRLLLEQEGPLPRGLLRQLQGDPRRGVRLLWEARKRREARDGKEKRRIRAMQRFEQQLRDAGATHVAGVDEAGMGPLAGPVIAAAVVFPAGTFLAGVDDSKRLSSGQRRLQARLILEAAAGVGIGAAEVAEIDRLNVYQAGLLAMERAVADLPLRADCLLLDGRELPGESRPQHGPPGGDRLHFSVAAASIVAKAHRDRIMARLDEVYPEYGFARHKGYGTRRHQQALRRHGPSPVHRRSFGVVRQLYGHYSEDFYRLRKRLALASTPAGVRRFEGELEDWRTRLSPPELRKLRMLLTRSRSPGCQG